MTQIEMMRQKGCKGKKIKVVMNHLQKSDVAMVREIMTNRLTFLKIRLVNWKRYLKNVPGERQRTRK